MDAHQFDHSFNQAGQPMPFGASVKTSVLCVGFDELYRVALQGSLPPGEFQLDFVEGEANKEGFLLKGTAQNVVQK